VKKEKGRREKREGRREKRLTDTLIGRRDRMYKQRVLMGVIGDEDTITGLLLAGVGNVDSNRKSNFLVVDSNTSVHAIEQAFHDMASRRDIAVILITQNVAEEIRHILDAYDKPVPSVLEIPSKDMPYDPSKDSILKKAQRMFTAE